VNKHEGFFSSKKYAFLSCSLLPSTFPSAGLPRGQRSFFILSQWCNGFSLRSFLLSFLALQLSVNSEARQSLRGKHPLLPRCPFDALARAGLCRCLPLDLHTEFKRGLWVLAGSQKFLRPVTVMLSFLFEMETI
jgi:hypothetical protein